MIPSIKRNIRQLSQSPPHWLALSLATACIVLQYMGLSDLLRFERSLIDSGHWWLLLSGNFVHLGPNHLWMNLAGLALIVALVWNHFTASQWLVVILLSSVCVGVGLWLFNPEVIGYVGFSGTLHGLILAGTLADLRVYPKSAAVLLLLVVGKLFWEQYFGALPGSESVAGGRVVVDSHLYGAIAGAVFGLILLAWRLLGDHRRQLSQS
ncbi:MAG: rhombosortase [Granulosicoccus sp.]|nr:rhombosortase [Granulosicoccus sp.]